MESQLPSHPKNEESVPAEGAEKGPSKSALKKAEKDAAKAAKKAATKKAEEERKAAAEAAAAAEDHSKDRYGDLPTDAERVNITRLKDLSEAQADQEVTVIVRIHNSRSQSAKLAFLMLRQQGKTIQAVIAAGDLVSKPMVKAAVGINVNSIVRVSGLLKKPLEPVASASISTLEIHITRIYTISSAIEQLPMQVKDAERPPPPETTEEGQAEADAEGPIVTLKTRLDNRVIDLQTNVNQAIFTISSAVEGLFEEYMRKHGSRKFNTPKLLGAATEGGSDVFKVANYFGRNAFLAQSPQLYKQMLIAGDCESVFELGPVFRAENSNTHRHLTEFHGLDFEMVFDHHYHEVLDFGEKLIVFIVSELQSRYKDEIATVQKFYPKAGDFKIKDGKALRMKYFDAVKILKDAGVDTTEQDAMATDLSTAMEKQLGKLIRAKYDTDFYVLDEFPYSVRPFYTKIHPTDPNLSNSYDFFMRGEEIMSGAQRVHDATELEECMRKKGLDPTQEGFQDYLDAFRQGCRPHAGGGLGLNRIVQFFLGLDNVRQATPFPRDPQRLRP